MATARLVPSTYYLSNSNYLSVSNANNMYTNTDSDTYGTVYNSRTSTSSYYIYLRGFNFSDIPSSAIVTSYTVKLKARESGGSTSSSYAPVFANGTTALSEGSTTALNTTMSVHTFTSTASWETIKNYGSNFGIRINCRRGSRNTACYIYIAGAEIEVTYTIPDPRTITVTLNGDGTVNPSGAVSTYDGEEFELTITPTNKTDTVTATKDGVDITDQLVPHGAGESVVIVPKAATTSGVQSGSSYAQYAVGHSAENPYSSTSNMYASQSSTGYAQYTFDFSDIPSTATIESIEVRCYGHRESNTISSTYVSQCAIYSGSSAISDTVDFPSTSNSMITLTPDDEITRAQLDNLTIRHYVGYYGGLVLGISFEVTYSLGTDPEYYTYTFTVSSDSVIAVVIGSPAPSDVLYFKSNGEWVSAIAAYKKVNGVWVLQEDLTSVFDAVNKYVYGGSI